MTASRLAIVFAAAALPAAALAQWQVGPVYPERGDNVYSGNPYSLYNTPPNYNPYRLNPYTGRFDYVPIPDQYPPTGSYDPFQLNLSTGRYNYVPIPYEPDPAAKSESPQGGTDNDLRLSPGR